MELLGRQKRICFALVSVVTRREVQLLHLLGDGLDNSPALKFISVDESSVYEALEIPGSAMGSIWDQLNNNGLIPNGDAVTLSDHVKVLDLNGIFDNDVVAELVARMSESLNGPERRDWISIKYVLSSYAAL